MPFINLKITRDGVTREQKTQVIAEFTETLERVLKKPPEWTHVVSEAITRCRRSRRRPPPAPRPT